MVRHSASDRSYGRLLSSADEIGVSTYLAALGDQLCLAWEAQRLSVTEVAYR